MLAVIHHRAFAYDELQSARTTLMGLKQMRSGLSVRKGGNAFCCQRLLNLLAEIAAVKLNALRLMLSLDVFEKQLRDENHFKKKRKIWLGRKEESQPEPHLEPLRIKRKMDGMTLFLLTMLAMHRMPKPRL